jgi:hypothetical protein
MFAAYSVLAMTTVDDHMPSSEFNRLNHTICLLWSRNRPTVHPHRISLIINSNDGR